MNSLFPEFDTPELRREELGEGAVVLHGFAITEAPRIVHAVNAVAAEAPFRHMTTPGGFRMSVAMTNCGPFGWVTDRKGYRYSPLDPESGKAWPEMPALFRDVAERAAAEAGFAGFSPDACLINRYEPGAKMSLHQDKDEQDFGAPIVSVSLGIPANFQFGGFDRSDEVRKVPLTHGDIVVWGGPSRLRYHGILPLRQNTHELTGSCRINLTFRRAH